MAAFNTLEGRCLDCSAFGDCPSTDEVDQTTGLLSEECCHELQSLEAKIRARISANLTAANPNESVYTGGPGVALYFVKAAAMLGEPELLNSASELLSPWKKRVESSAAKNPAIGCSLLCGRAGWLCVEALRLHVAGDKDASQQETKRFSAMATVAASSALDADEWLYGRAGYLHGCLLLRHVCGDAAVPDSAIKAVSEAILKSGQRYASAVQGVGPMMFRWYGSEYLGAAHGIMGIVFVLLHVDCVVQDAERRRLLVNAMEWIISQKAPSGNWPAVRGQPRDHLVHFCHGAPGAVHLFCKAYEVLDEPRYLAEAEAAGELVWRYGMLRKGPSLCHGFSGNGYVFLALFRATREPRWLVRSYHYARVMMRPDVEKLCRTPDNPLSLFEGVAGAACFLLDLRLAPMTSALPFFEVGWLRSRPVGLVCNSEDKAMVDVMLQNNSQAPAGVDEESDIESVVSQALCETLGEDMGSINRDENLLSSYFHSVSIASFSTYLQERVPEPRKRRVRPRLVFDHPTVRSMVRCLVGRCHCLTCRSDRFNPLDAGGHPAAPPQESVLPEPRHVQFTQLLSGVAAVPERVYAALGSSKYSRATDGMVCVELPGATAWIGDGLDGRSALAVEKPCHQVPLSTFLMDIEPVSVGAYARFLSSVQPSDELLADWLDASNVTPVSKIPPVSPCGNGAWEPLGGVSPQWPMMNVTWYGANAYSLWANGLDWATYRDAEGSCLPTEAQWEYAARGPLPANFPWGDSPASAAFLNVAWESWPADTSDTPLCNMPLADVNCELGTSPFGLRHMAGNVWQWCKDTYQEDFYAKEDASLPDAWNKTAGETKTERGGSWVGPAYLARSSYRRGRPATAKGPCLGFRCVGRVQ